MKVQKGSLKHGRVPVILKEAPQPTRHNMFSTISWLALAASLLVCTEVFCKRNHHNSDNCDENLGGNGKALRPQSSHSFEDFQAAIDNYKKGSSASKVLHHQSSHPYTPFAWEVRRTNLITSVDCTATRTIATHTERCRGVEITWSFQTTRARTRNWRSTITEETYTRITDSSNTTIITVTDRIWGDNIEDTHITETVFSDFIDDAKVNRDMTWGTQRNSFVGDGTVPCDATIWRLSIGYRGTGYDAQRDCACASYVANCNGQGGPYFNSRLDGKLLDECPPTCTPIVDTVITNGKIDRY